MSDVYVPGIKSRFDTEKLVEDLMKIERIPKDRVEKNIERLQSEKTYWQDLGRRMSLLRESARLLYSFQNPFNDRLVISKDDSVITGTATRDAVEQERSFIVKQIAQADRFLSDPLEDSYKIEAGIYKFSLGEDELSFNFRGGSLREFTDTLNRRAKDKIKASLITVKPGTKSLLIESLVTGEAYKLIPSEAAEALAIKTGMMERINDSRKNIDLKAQQIQSGSVSGEGGGQAFVTVQDGVLEVKAGGKAAIPVVPPITSEQALILKYETKSVVLPQIIATPQPPPGPSIPPAGSASYGGVTVDNDPFLVPLPAWTPPEPPERVDNAGVLFLNFSDGTRARLPDVADTGDFRTEELHLAGLAANKTVVSIEFINDNTHRDISIRNIHVFDPDALGGLAPRNPVSRAQNALISMDGIEVTRERNTIDDLIPGVTITAKAPSEKPVQIGVEPDREAVKEALISLVGNYNRLVAELNTVTRNDERIIEELSYLSEEEQESLRKRMGVFSGDSLLNQFKTSLQRIVTSPYPTSAEQDLTLLAQIGIGTDMRRTGGTAGYDPSRLRGYLEIDEKALDGALQTKMPFIQQLFGYDTNGDLIVDSGIAYSIEAVTKPYVETGGFITLKTDTADARVNQEKQRIDTLDRQLAAKEAALKKQYSQMEGVYNRMDQMSTSLDQFVRQNNNNR
ncbi:MAG: flagellar filament capping protein FliD [Treponema sp.]|jgi:flagellar hook-associated protein 2|nr:flagellar filament capping protein FliD [Treponema sp.]